MKQDSEVVFHSKRIEALEDDIKFLKKAQKKRKIKIQ